MATFGLILALFYTINAVCNPGFQKRTFYGYITHGINNFNGQKIVDIPEVPFFDIPLYEIAVTDSELPTESTDRSQPIISVEPLVDPFQTPNAPPNFIGKPIRDLGVNIFESSSPYDRIKPSSFDRAEFKPFTTYYPENTLLIPTLSDFEKASGELQFTCNEIDGSSIGELTICNGIPNSLYTLWEVGVNGVNQSVVGIPAGGVANVFRTNKYGNSKYIFKLPWCPLNNECNNFGRCIVYYTAFLHWDYAIYGSAPVPCYWNPNICAGTGGANQLYFAIQGTPLQEQLNGFQCNGDCD